MSGSAGLFSKKKKYGHPYIWYSKTCLQGALQGEDTLIEGHFLAMASYFYLPPRRRPETRDIATLTVRLSVRSSVRHN